MLDFVNFANARNGADYQVFNALGASDIQSWVKPRGKSHVSIITVNPGGGGGGGFSAAAATARGGGGGGGGGAIARLVGIPIDLVPDVLYILVGLGGTGGAAGTAGAPGVWSTVMIRSEASLLSQNRLLIGGSAAAAGGGGGTATVVGTAGLASSASANYPMGMFGVFVSNAGINGGAGGAIAGGVGQAVLWGNTSIGICGGAGGGGTTAADFAGGAITSAGWFPTIAGGPAGSNRGNDGFFSQVPWGASGGSGGGSSNTSIGGAGGNGAIGSGGGGGGAGVSGGAGGNGGNGLVIISCW